MDPSWGRRGGASRLGRFVRLLPETRVPAGLPCTDGRIRLIHAPGGRPRLPDLRFLADSDACGPLHRGALPAANRCCRGPRRRRPAVAVAERTDHKPAGKVEVALRQAGTVEAAVAALEGRIDRDATHDIVPAYTPSCNRRTSTAAPAATTP